MTNLFIMHCGRFGQEKNVFLFPIKLLYDHGYFALVQADQVCTYTFLQCLNHLIHANYMCASGRCISRG